MSALSLAGVGWVAGAPAGNRLLFSWPGDAQAAGVHLDPHVLVLERAPLDEWRPTYGAAAAGTAVGLSGSIAPQLWVSHGDVPLIGAAPIVHPLGARVQAVRFVYHGPATKVLALSGLLPVEVREVSDGEWVWLAGAEIDSLLLMTGFCTLGMLATADLRHPPPLPWREIAEIQVAATAGASFAQAANRYPGPPTMTPEKWSELLALWTQAWAEAPGAPGPNGGPNAWEALQLVLAARWEHSVECGLGFVDGPGRGAPELDRIDLGALLQHPAAVAYRVRDAAARLDPSNVICIPGALAADPAPPPAPSMGSGAVRLRTSGAISASWDLSWHTGDPATVAVEVTETVLVAGAPPQSEHYQARGRQAGDPPGSGLVHREVEVGGPLVTVSAQVRALDGFDRASAWSPAAGPQTIPLDHHPQPPHFDRATHDGLLAALVQPDGAAPWAPDPIVAATGGRVQILRRTGVPAALDVHIDQVVKTGDGLYALHSSDPAPSSAAQFIGGALTVGSARGTVTAIAWPVIALQLPYAAKSPLPAIAAPAKARLTQSIVDPALWQQVADLAASGFPATATIPDPLPSPTSTELLDYRGRVSFAGQLGPMGPAVQALRLPDTPTQPPPFTVTTLGVDFYQRTLVQLTLTKPRSDALEVWWADGAVADADFPRAATPGDAGARTAEDSLVLWETLSLPIPNQVDRTVTIGITGVNAADGRSPFSIVQHTLPRP